MILKTLRPYHILFIRHFTDPNSSAFGVPGKACAKAFPERINYYKNLGYSWKEINDKFERKAQYFMRIPIVKKEIDRIIKKNMPEEYSLEFIYNMFKDNLNSTDPRESLKAKEIIASHMARITEMGYKYGHLKDTESLTALSTEELIERYKNVLDELTGNSKQLPGQTDNSNELTEPVTSKPSLPESTTSKEDLQVELKENTNTPIDITES